MIRLRALPVLALAYTFYCGTGVVAQSVSKEYIWLGDRLVAIESGAKVSVSPSSATLSAGQTKQFKAIVSGLSSSAVNWSISPQVGTIDASGLYVAPTSISTGQTIVVTATSAADPTKSGSATVSLASSSFCATTAPSSDFANPFSYSNGVFSLNGTNESVYCAMTGDGTIVARVISAQSNSYFTSTGVFMSDGPNPAATRVSLSAPVNDGGCFCVITASLPYWLKLVRTSGMVTKFVSENGVDWTQSGTPVPLAGSTVYAGLFIGGAMTVFFDTVQVSTVPDFYLATWPTSWASSAAGDTASYQLVAGTMNGFSGPVSFTVSNLPSGVTGIVNPASFSGSGASTLTVTVPRGAPAGNYEFVVNASGGTVSHSSTVILTVGNSAPIPLPDGWKSMPYNTTDPINTASFANGVYSLTGRSELVYKPLAGDGTFIARVTGVQNNGNFASAYLLLATGLDANAARATVGVPNTETGCFCLQGGLLPYWLKLQRSGDSVTAYFSTNGADWTQSGSPIAVPGTTVYAGMAIGVAYWSAPMTVTFDNVRLASTSGTPDFSLGLPADPQEVIAGESLDIPASIVTTGGYMGTIAFSAAGLPTGATSAFSPPTIKGDGSTVLTLNTAAGSTPDNYTLTVAGLSDIGSRLGTVALTVDPAGTAPPAVASISPSSIGGSEQTVTITFTDPVSAANLSWVEVLVNRSFDTTQSCYLHYDASTNTAYLRDDVAPLWSASGPFASTGKISNSQCAIDTGRSFAVISGTQLTLTLALAFTANLAGTQNVYAIADNGALNSGWTDAIATWEIPAPSGSLPGGWTVAVKDANHQGSYTNGTFSLTGYNNRIAQPMVGDGTIVARIVAVYNNGWFTSAGIFMADGLSLSANTAYVGLPSGGFCFCVNTGVLPYWVKLVRTGSVVTGYVSSDGENWTQSGSPQTLAGSIVYVGMSESVGVFGPMTVTYDHVSLGGGGPDYYLLESRVGVRVNAGGGAYTDLGGTDWSADYGSNGGNTYGTGAAISNTPSPGVYQTERNSATLQYQFPVPNGTYTVTLKFAEIYFTQIGQRVFHIALNGTTVRSNFDIVQEAGGPNIAVDLQYPVMVTDGLITIVLTGVTWGPKISGIEIVPASPGFSFKVVPLNGFNGTATLSVSGLPAGTTYAFNPTAAGVSSPATLTMTPPGSIPAGNYPLLVSATSGSIVHSIPVNLQVRGTPAAPVFAPPGGTYGGPQTVTLTCANPGALIRYTTDGSAPSSTTGTLYTGPFVVSGNMTVNAIAFGVGAYPSAVASAAYVITNTTAAAPVTYSVPAGVYSVAQSIALSTTTAGAAIRYTVDGVTEPTDSVGTLYSGPIFVNTTTTIKAVAYLSGFANSVVTLATYTLDPPAAAPSISPNGGIYPTQQTVTMTTSTPGAIIRYTTDGTTPTPLTGQVYSGPITVNNWARIKAITYANHYAPSAISSAWVTVESNRKAIIIDHARVSGSSPLQNFPVLVSLTDPSFRTMGGGVARSDGGDIAFTAADGTTQLDHELESYDQVNGQVTAWVRVPSISPSTDTLIYIYYGNTTTPDLQNRSGVWDANYKAVFHMSDSSANTIVQDSSASASFALNQASTGSKSTPGKIASALAYNGSTDSTSAARTVQDDMTLCSWFKTGASGTGFAHYQTLSIITAETGGVTNDFGMGLDGSGKLAFGTGGGSDITISGNTTVNDNTWHFGCATRVKSSGALAVYVDGHADGSGSGNAGVSLTANSKLKIGDKDDSPQNRFNGLIDQVEISNIVRTADWIATEYNNQSSPTTFAILAVPPAAPSTLTATAGSMQIALNWTPTAWTTSYTLKRATSTGGPYSSIASGITATTYTDSTATNGTTYYYVVSAVNSYGAGPNSAEASATAIAVPGISGVSNGSGGTPQLMVSWNAAAGAVNYNVKRATTNGGPYSIVGASVTGLTYIDTNVTAGATYYYVVSGLNSSGESNNSSQASAVALGAPTGVSAAPGNGQIILTWTAGPGSSSHTVKRGTVSGGPYGTTVATGLTATTYTDTTVTNGTTYYYVVVAVGGGGEASSAQVSVTPIGVPAGLAVVTGNGSGQLSISWAATAGAGTYNVKRSATPGGPYSTVATVSALSYTDTGLTGGTVYYYVISGANSGGEGSNSAQVSGTAIATPSGLTAAAGTASVALGWSTTPGASSYTIRRGTVSGGPYGTTVASGVTATTYTDTTVTNGTTYYYVVAGVNATGASSNSAQLSATPMAAPTGVAVTTGTGSTQLAINWSAVAGASSYNVKRATTSGGPYTTIGTPSATSFTNTGLTAGTTYYFVVSAVNSSGESVNSSQASGVPVATPTGLSATTGNKRVTLNWTAAAGATSYNIKRATTNGGPYTTIATGVTGTSYVNNGLTNGTTYYYVISAVNSSGEGANSAQVSATP